MAEAKRFLRSLQRTGTLPAFSRKGLGISPMGFPTPRGHRKWVPIYAAFNWTPSRSGALSRSLEPPDLIHLRLEQEDTELIGDSSHD